MSSHSSNNSNADMEVINAEDLEDSPPPGDAEDVPSVEEMKNVQETKEEEVVVEATASGDTEQIGEIGDVDGEIVNKSATEEVAAVEEEEDDTPIEILEAPTPPVAEESVPEPVVEVVPAVEVAPAAEVAPAVEVAPTVEVAPIVAAVVPADPSPAATIVETESPTQAVAPALVNDDDDDPPIEILEAPTPPPAQESVLKPVVEVAPAAVEVAPVVAAAPTPAVSTVEAPAAATAAPAPAPAAPQPQVVSVRPTVTAERPAATLEEVDDEEEDDDDIDETLAERLVGLTEMFPDFVRTGSVSLVKSSWSFTQSCYSLGRAASWVVFSSATILFMPIMIESERLQMQDQMKAQKNQILLGPGAAVSGGPSLGPPPI